MKPRYEVRILSMRSVPLSAWQWCPDPTPHAMSPGLRLTFEVPTLKVIAKGRVDRIQVRIDGALAMECDIFGGKVRPGDTFEIMDLELKMEMN